MCVYGLCSSIGRARFVGMYPLVTARCDEVYVNARYH